MNALLRSSGFKMPKLLGATASELVSDSIYNFMFNTKTRVIIMIAR